MLRLSQYRSCKSSWRIRSSASRLTSALNLHNAAKNDDDPPRRSSSAHPQRRSNLQRNSTHSRYRKSNQTPSKMDETVTNVLQQFFTQIPPKEGTPRQGNAHKPLRRKPMPRKPLNTTYSRVDLEQKLQSGSSSSSSSMVQQLRDRIGKARNTSPPPTGRLDLQGSVSEMRPRWRIQSDNNTIRSQRQPEQQQQEPQRQESYAALLKKKRKVKPTFVDPRSQTILIPGRSLDLVETSALFRVKLQSIRNGLRSIGVTVDDGDGSLLDPETLELLALELDLDFVRANRRDDLDQDDDELLLRRRAQVEESLAPRPPVVCIMGHVDHGKTTLMDALRRRASGATSQAKKKKRKGKKAKVSKGTKSSSDDVAGTEAGGITQTISAFQVPLVGHEFGAVTFLDTPGHAAFKSMRQSGSDAADIIVLVVAADDGVSEQTVEILNFYKSIVKGSDGGIALIIAMNKIDKPGVNPDEARVMVESQLLEHGILVEGMPSSDTSEYGPPVQLFPISGLTGDGLDDLIEGLALQSEVMDLRADDSARAEGVVLDARVDKGLGIVADCIIRWGTIAKGDVVVSGTTSGKVRLLKDVNDKQLQTGSPSQPVRIIGFNEVPSAGYPLIVAASDELAEELIEKRKTVDAVQVPQNGTSVSDAELQSAGKSLMNQAWEAKLREKHGIHDRDETPIRIPVLVKANANGSLAAIRDCLVAIADESKLNVVVDPVKQGVGPATAAEVQMAKECDASIFCFNIKNEQRIMSMADEHGVSLCQNDVIYRLLEEAREKFANYLPPVPTEVVHGRGRVKAIYEINGSGKVAGMLVTDGVLYMEKSPGSQTCEFRVLRDGAVISEETSFRATTLRHYKDDVNEISKGNDCGLALRHFDAFEEGDVVECFSIEMKREFV